MVMAVMQGCKYENEEELFGIEICDFETIGYQENVVPIINQYCATCHNSDDPAGGIILDTYMSLKDQVDSGKLWCSINHGDDCANMPDDQPKLSECELLIIKTWIDEGAQQN